MGLIRFAIENPVKVAVGVILLVLFGLLTVLDIPIQLTPDVDRPIITVATTWRGASPQEIEREIIDRQEDKLKNCNNLKKMTSEATRGQATIRLEFPVGVDKNVAYIDVSDKLRQVTDYPDEVDEPTISKTDDDMANVIAWLILYSDSDTVNVAALKTEIEEDVKPLLERADGISEVNVYGGLDREIQVFIDPFRLAARSLTFQDVAEALRAQNTNISAGTIIQGKRDYSYRTLGEYTTVEEVEDTVIAYDEGGPVLVRDVADVVDGFRKQFAFVRSKGQFVIAMPCRRETGANVLQAMENLKEQISLVNATILHPRGLSLELTQVYDETVYINSSIDLVINNVYTGGFLAIVVLLLFLRSGSATGIIAVSIPISVVGTFLIIALLGRSLNVIMLAGMAFATGMIVDNSIVVLENIYRHRSMGKSRMQAALDGAHEVWGAVLASTLTTMVVFLPVIFVEEEAGQLFRDIAIAISSAIVLSLVVSILVIPPLASRFFGASKAITERANRPYWIGEHLGRIVGTVNRSTLARLGLAGGVTGLSIFLTWLLVPPSEYLPAGNKNLIFGFFLSPPGYSVEEFKQMATIVEEGDPAVPNDGIRPFWEAKPEDVAKLPTVDIPVGIDGGEIREVKPPAINNFFFVTFGGVAFMGCTSRDAENVKPLEFVMERAGRRVPGVFSMFTQASLFQSGRTAGNTVDLEIRGDDISQVTAAAGVLVGKIMEAGYGYPSPSPANFNLGAPEIQIVPRRALAAEMGLDVSRIGFITESLVDGAYVGEFNDRGDKIDMVLRVAGTENASVREFSSIPVFTPRGGVVTLDSFCDLRSVPAPQQINHIEEMNAVTLSVEPKPGVALGETMRELQEDIIGPLRKSGAIPTTVFTVLAGTADKLTQTQRALVGDFNQSMTRPRIFGLPVWASVTLLMAAVVAAAIALGFVVGRRRAIVFGMLGMAAVIAVVLGLNPLLSVGVLQSRMLLALIVTYLLMSALFESFVYPFIIMFTVPLATVGGFAALRIVHEVSLYDITAPTQQMDVLTMLGFVILIGIVVNNAILIVHQALNYGRNEGMALQEAIVKSVATRTRPIFMTALTSCFGLVPLVVVPGAGSELYRGLGSVVLGGLLVSTVFTLVVIPTLFSLTVDAQARLLAWMGADAPPATRQTRASAPATAAGDDLPDAPGRVAEPAAVVRSPEAS